MSVGLDSSHAVELVSAVAQQSFNPTAMSRLEGSPVVRSPEQLRFHPAMKELGWTGVIDELNAAARLKDHSVPEQVLITTNGTILAGFGRWRLAMLEGRHEINCIEYPLGEDEALQCILTHHQTRCGWNDFVRIRLALTLEPTLQQRALDNKRAGGKYKSSTNLSEEIARRSGTGTGNIGKVKAILLRAHPNIIAAFGCSVMVMPLAIGYAASEVEFQSLGSCAMLTNEPETWVQAFAPDEVGHELLHTDHGQVSGTMAERAARLDTVFVPPPTAGDDDKLFVDLQSKFWKVACSFTHGG
jgi:hypothetical protein